MGSPRRPAVDPFTLLIAPYVDLVHRKVRRTGVPVRDVPDVAQQVFVKLHAAIGRGLDTSKSLAGWLSRVTYTTACDYLKQAGKAGEVLSDTAGVEVADDAQNPEERMAPINAHDIVDLVLDGLSHEHRAVLVMSDVDDMPMSEIAGALGIPVGTGYSRLRAARLAFKQSWEDRRASGHAMVLPFALWSVRDLLAAERSTPPAPPGFEAELRGRLRDTLGSALAGAGVVAGTAAGTAGMALTKAQAAAGVVAAMLAGAGVFAGVRAALGGPGNAVAVATVVSRDEARATGAGSAPAVTVPGVATSALAKLAAPIAEPSGGPSSGPRADAPLPPHGGEISERTLLERARLALDRGDAAGALSLLARVKTSRFAVERDQLRRAALAYQDGGP